MAITKILSRSWVDRFPGAKYFSTKPKPNFGLLFDIDGVIVRGKNVIPSAPAAFKRLTDNGKFRVPTVFVTNSGNALRSEKAADLSRWIGFEISEEQVIVAHTPLQLFRQFHDKQVLISGQGRVKEIAKELGFKKTVTMDELVANFPSLDYVNKDKRDSTCGPVDPKFPTIEGVVLLSEPTQWETPLQLIVDLLLTNGMPSYNPKTAPYPHIPVLACNMDLLWVSEAPIPRYGHGAFLLCLEMLYKKVTGRDMIYSSLVGKPSEITYYHANHKLMQHAKSIGIEKVDTIYAVGDNINTDVYGANLYDKYLARYSTDQSSRLKSLDAIDSSMEVKSPCAKTCVSVLVETGVHRRDSEFSAEHCQRDFLPVEDALCKPAFVVDNVGCAIDLAFKEEKYE